MRHVIATEADGKALEGKEIGISEWVLIDQARLDMFAEATNDHQWIHVDPERAAREMPTGKTIAHGYLLISLIPGALDDFVEFRGLKRAINYGINKVRFKNMVPVGSRVRLRSTVKSARKRAGALQFNLENVIEIEGEKKPACTAETIGMYYLEGV